MPGRFPDQGTRPQQGHRTNSQSRKLLLHTILLEIIQQSNCAYQLKIMKDSYSANNTPRLTNPNLNVTFKEMFT